MKIRILNHGVPTLAAAAAAIAVFAATSAGAATLLTSDFTGVSKSGNTASNISWTTDSLTLSSSDLSFIDMDTSASLSLFDVTADEIDVNKNMNSGGWQTSLEFSVDAGTTLDLATLAVDFRLTTGTGSDNTTQNKTGGTLVEVTGSSSGSLGSVDTGVASYPSTPYTRTLDLSGLSTLDDSETYTLLLTTYGGDGTWGHHKSLQSFTLEGGVAGIPEPASLALLGLGLASLSLRRRRR